MQYEWSVLGATNGVQVDKVDYGLRWCDAGIKLGQSLKDLRKLLFCLFWR